MRATGRSLSERSGCAARVYPSSHVCPTPDCNLESEGEPIHPDSLHFDGRGAEETARWTLRESRRVAGG